VARCASRPFRSVSATSLAPTGCSDSEKTGSRFADKEFSGWMDGLLYLFYVVERQRPEINSPFPTLLSTSRMMTK
jgi:hypothetical protein